jgi:hypothetical protein
MRAATGATILATLLTLENVVAGGVALFFIVSLAIMMRVASKVSDLEETTLRQAERLDEIEDRIGSG